MLFFFNQRLHREEFEQWRILSQDHSLPEPAHSSVTIREWVNELSLVSCATVSVIIENAFVSSVPSDDVKRLRRRFT